MDGSEVSEDALSKTTAREAPVPLSRLPQFKYTKTLSSSKESKTVVVQGCFQGDSRPALIILEKQPFEEDHFKSLFTGENEVKETFQNDVYYGYNYYPKEVFNGVNVTGIFPATEKHILKYEQLPVHIIEETPELYQTVTLPFLKGEQFSLKWVYNILEHKSETDRIIYEDTDSETGFILCYDLKWDGISFETFHALALPFRRDIMSIRDLTQKDLPLLKNIYNKGIKAIEEKYSIKGTQLRVYVHYQPSFYHFHVHFTHVKNTAPGSNTERAHLLQAVINNLELVSNYYQISKLYFPLKESENLFSKYEALCLVERQVKK